MGVLRIVHTADYHLGVSLRGLSPVSEKGRIRIQDFLKQLDRIRGFVLDRGCDFLVIAGDVFHTIRPNPYVFDEFAKFIRSLTVEKVQVVCIAGTHDQPRTEASEAYVKALEDVGAPNFYFFRKPGVITLKGSISGKKVRFLCLPYVPQTMFKPDEYISSVERSIRRLLSEPVEPYDYTVVVGHFYVEGAVINSREHTPRYIGDIPLPRRLFNGFDASMLGHIHRHQFLTGKIVYAGSIERIDFGEEGEEKGFVYFEEYEGGLRGSFIRLPCRPMLTIPRDGFLELRGRRNYEAVLREYIRGLRGVEDAILRFKMRLDPSQVIPSRALEEALRSKKVFHWIIEVERVGGEAKPVERKVFSLEDYFKHYVETVFKHRLDPETMRLVVSEGLKILKEED